MMVLGGFVYLFDILSARLSNCGIALAWTWEDALIGEIVGKYLARVGIYDDVVADIED